MAAETFDDASVIAENYSFKRILCLNDKDRSASALFEEVNGEKNAIIYVKKMGFKENEIRTLTESMKNLDVVLKNPPFYTYEATLNIPFMVNTTIIVPANESMIRKYSYSKLQMFEESYETYQRITHPYFLQESRNNNQWIYNIIEGTAEANRVLYKDEDFCIVADLIWNMKDMTQIYLLVILTRRDILSLRQLDSTLISLLTKIRTTARKIMAEKYKVNEEDSQIYVHYLPSFSHFHVHVTLTCNGKTDIGKAHFLSDIIENISMIPDYYQRAKLTIQIPSHHKLASQLSTIS